MSAKRVVARCPDCGAEISVPVNVVGRARCGACRAERARADKRAYAARRKAADAEGYRRAQAAAQRASYARQKAADPAGFLARKREKSYRYREANPERWRELTRAAHVRRMADPEAHARMLERKRALYRAHKEAKKGTASGIMALLAQKRRLQECPRLHVRATSLPCGRRPECFGKIRCDKCPAGAAPPSGLDNPWAVNVVGW